MEMYKVVHFGASIGIGVSKAISLGIAAVGKCNSPQNPYVVPNEIIAAEIGHYLRLPIPPWCVVTGPAGNPHFASLDFNLTGNSLPPIIPPAFYTEFREHTGAVVAFDVYIANSDRHAGNLSADYAGKQFNVFDHSHVLLSGTNPQGKDRLLAVDPSLVVDASLGGSKHCLLNYVDDDGLFAIALERIESIPDWFIEDVVTSAASYGLDVGEADALVAFLKKRRRDVRSLLSGNKPAFSGIKKWVLL